MLFFLLISKKVKYDFYDKIIGGIVVLGFLISLINTIIFDTSFLNTFIQIRHISFFMLTSIFIKNQNLSLTQIKYTVLFFMTGTLFNIILVLIQFLYDNEDFTQLVAFYRNPSVLGTTIAMFISYLFYFISSKDDFFSSRKLFTNFVIIISIPLFIFALFITGSRTGMLALGLVSFVYLFRFKINIFYKFSFISIIILFTSLIFSNIDIKKLYPILGRLTLEEVSSGAGRVDLWKASFLIMEEAPIIGIGLGQFYNLSTQYTNRLFDARKTVLTNQLTLHNTYLQMLVEVGWIGFILFIGINIKLYMDVFKTYKLTNKNDFSFFLIIIFFFLTILSFFQFSFVLQSYHLFLSILICHNNLYLNQNKI
tara:strand:- start:1367 stop:2467 length:1101 start_codon:yes stop_codon:yes gene_type:complete